MHPVRVVAVRIVRPCVRVLDVPGGHNQRAPYLLGGRASGFRGHLPLTRVRYASHRSTCRRTPLMTVACSYCCCSVKRPFHSSNIRADCSAADPCRFLGFGIGVMNATGLRLGMVFQVGCPA